VGFSRRFRVLLDGWIIRPWVEVVETQ